MPQDRKKRVKANEEVKGKAEAQSCCGAAGSTLCKVESLVSIDERGQMILPKELRDRAKIRAGDKLAVTSLERDGKMCCILLTKAEDLSSMVITVLGPVVKEMTQRL
jgi:AbrB family looped-hinge helix DNA binding protein